MSKCHILRVDASYVSQTLTEDSYIGGVPKLPRGQDIPHCKLCGAAQSFFFQVAFPRGNPWEGLSLSVFACTSCADRGHLIPEMLSGPVRHANIPAEFLASYETNFRFLVFETASAIPYDAYEPRVVFRRLDLVTASDPDIDENKIGGSPNWLLEDESPGLVAGNEPMFLLQLLPEFRFVITPTAPRQVELGLDRNPRRSTEEYYELFVGNKLFLFGAKGRTDRHVYAITQVD